MRRFLLLLPFALAVGCASSSPQKQPPEAPDLDYPVGAFKLTDSTGKTVTDADLKGKVWVASFIFTNCSGPCPHVSATMAKLRGEMPSPDDLLFVSFTVDPERDTPAKLQEYAKNFNAKPDRWLFLTGPEKDVHELLTKRFKQAVEKNTAKDVKPGEEIFHSSRLAVVDRKGVIRGVFDGVPSQNQPDADKAFEENLARLKKKVVKLLDE